VRRGRIPRELIAAAVDGELRPRNGEPCDECGAVIAAAHAAMAVAAEQGREHDGESDRAAEAAAADWLVGHGLM